MNVVKLKNAPANYRFNSFIDDFFTQIPSVYRGEVVNGMRTSVPVNIKEIENGFEIELVAPGFKKEDFKINLEKNLLTISVDMKAEEKTEKYIRREFGLKSFTRFFTLDENIEAEAISAQYVNGVLLLNLPKKVAVKEPVKQISIL